MASANIVILNEQNFESEVLQSDKPVLVDFWAEWCGPCKKVTPIVDELAEEFEDKIKVAKLNVDDNRNLAMKYRVMSIPTILFFQQGEVVNREVGTKSKEDYIHIIHSL